MSLIRVDNSKLTGKQGKYQNKNFYEMLETSQELPDETKVLFRKAGFGVSERSYDDQAISRSNGKNERFLDIDGINYHSKENFKIECKDFSRFGKYDMIGVPCRYITEKAIFFPYVIFIFRYNPKVIESLTNCTYYFYNIHSYSFNKINKTSFIKKMVIGQIFCIIYL